MQPFTSEILMKKVYSDSTLGFNVIMIDVESFWALPFEVKS